MIQRKIDGKFRIEVGTEEAVGQCDKIRIVSKTTEIPQDEPMFLLHARDHMAIYALLEYRRMCIRDGYTEQHLDGIDDAMLAFDGFAREHPERMKQPGISNGRPS